MKQFQRTVISGLALALFLLAGHERLAAQGTAFTYQGALQFNNQPANGAYDLTFTLYAVPQRAEARWPGQ